MEQQDKQKAKDGEVRPLDALVMQTFTVEEQKNAVGLIMRDCRGNWAFKYGERCIEISKLIKQIHKISDENYSYDMGIADSMPRDGRTFRDSCELYEYKSEEGRTERMFKYVSNYLTYPEYLDMPKKFV